MKTVADEGHGVGESSQHCAAGIESDAVSVSTAVLRVKTPWLIGFGLAGVAELVFVASHRLHRADLITLWIVAPLLAIWTWRARGPKLLVLALMLCWVGDVLGNPAAIGIGRSGLLLSVVAYVGANVCLIILFVRDGALTALRKAFRGSQRWRVGIASLYLVAAIIGLALAWNGLGPMLHAGAAIYLLLLVGTAATALALDTCAGIGAALFFGSELVIALEVGGRLDGTAASFRLAVLALYMFGILLIAVGVVKRELRTKRESLDGTEPVHRVS